MDKNNENKEINQENNESFEDVSFVESTEDGEALPQKDIVKKLREEIKSLQKEKEEYLTGWQRAKADYVNLQKEHGESHVRNSVLVKEKFLKSLLPALDSFDMAFSNKEAWENVDKNWRMGVEYIYQQLMTSLLDEGIDKIDSLNVSFDPKIHESVEMLETDDKSKDHKIAKIIQVGYKIGHRVVRPARVNLYEFKKE